MLTVEQAAGLLLDAERSATDRPPLTDQWPRLDLATAYAVQDETLRRRTAGGDRLVGVKLGLTSAAKQRRMGVDAPLTAWLTESMMLAEGDPVPLKRLIHPRVEPEIVFVMRERLSGPGVTPETALRAVGEVRAGLDVIDSRYRDFRFTLPDVVADNASSAAFVVGSLVRAPGDTDLVREACELEVDGRVVDRATGAAVQGDPAAALALAANSLGARGLALEPGWIVLSGALTDAVPVGPGSRVTARYTSLGAVTLEA
ncbi:4-oxalocrotonate decarboxylase [Streptomyces sp. CB03234]|uniref:2-keto-4-pentenoate hydratase n=1 Tax=Streptomyces sp. (strain CB03234) TaxID=1703937 RepID=UPI00093EED6C|nr:fumarylacetoacetate hydrolase family protein [Streptomyces sp. CB03234]OKJ94698.1 4-oxalocrotonate decarboxylase [Streptomyces sp. CB03234]